MEKQAGNSGSFFSPNRLEALTDGVFAIAMTLMVLSLDLPGLPGKTTEAELFSALRGLALPLFKYAISFLLLGTFWVIHIRQAHHVRRVDVIYLWFGMGALLLITLVPFSTSLVGDYPDMRPAEYFFHLNILGISTLYVAQWTHATRHHRLVEPDLPTGMIEKERRLGLLIPAFAIMGLMLAAEGPFESNLLYAAVPLLAALLRRFSQGERRHVTGPMASRGTRERILLFVKAPRAGLVKTRLVPVLGPGGAEALYRAFGLDFLETLRQLGCPVTACFHPREEIAAVQEWLGTGLSYVPQEGEDLGRRMDHAFRAAFDAEEDRVLAVGGDTPDLPATLLEEAFRVLGESDAVLVPAMDGGYASIGFTRQGYCPEAFSGIAWGTPSVLDQTLAILAARGTRVGRLDPWPDVDTHADLEALRVRLGQSGACPAVRALLGKGETG